MTEYEYSKIQDALEAREEHRIEICNDCEHKAHSRTGGKDYCVYVNNGEFDGRPIDDMCACSVDGYCDRWNEVGWDYPEISPEGDAERERLRKEA